MTAVENLVKATLRSRQAKKLAKQRQLEAGERQGLQNYRSATLLLAKAIEYAQETILLTIEGSPTLNKLLSGAKEYQCYVSGECRSHILPILNARRGEHVYELILSRNPYRVTLAHGHSSDLGSEGGRSWFVDRAENWDVDYARRWYIDGSDRLAFIKRTTKDLNSLTCNRVAKIILDYFEKHSN